MELPFLLCPRFQKNNKVLVCKAVGDIGCTQIKHLVNQVGEWDLEGVLNKLKVHKVKHREDVITNIFQKGKKWHVS